MHWMKTPMRTLAVGLLAVSAAYAETEPTLRAEILAADAAMFAAFNTCRGDDFGVFMAGDIEFYHDNDGVIRDADALIRAVDTSICGNFTRQALTHTFEVWPIPGFGAIQTGWHTFTNEGAEAPHGMARFLHIWRRQEDGGWVTSRVVSFDHRAYDAAVIP